VCSLITHSLHPHRETPDRTESVTSDAEMPAVLFPVNLLQAAGEAEKTTLCEPQRQGDTTGLKPKRGVF